MNTTDRPADDSPGGWPSGEGRPSIVAGHAALYRCLLVIVALTGFGFGIASQWRYHQRGTVASAELIHVQEMGREHRRLIAWLAFRADDGAVYTFDYGHVAPPRMRDTSYWADVGSDLASLASRVGGSRTIFLDRVSGMAEIPELRPMTTGAFRMGLTVGLVALALLAFDLWFLRRLALDGAVGGEALDAAHDPAGAVGPRRYRRDEVPAIVALFDTVFTQAEGAAEGQRIGRLVAELLTEPVGVGVTAFVVDEGESLVGAVGFSPLAHAAPAGPVVMLLSPLAVRPDRQRRGIGQALLRAALATLAADGVDLVVTYGDPAFYGKLGFAALSTDAVQPPYPLSQPQGWLGLALREGAGFDGIGAVRCVPAFMDPGLW